VRSGGLGRWHIWAAVLQQKGDSILQDVCKQSGQHLQQVERQVKETGTWVYKRHWAGDVYAAT
jgi:hypothetical protein